MSCSNCGLLPSSRVILGKCYFCTIAEKYFKKLNNEQLNEIKDIITEKQQYEELAKQKSIQANEHRYKAHCAFLLSVCKINTLIVKQEHFSRDFLNHHEIDIDLKYEESLIELLTDQEIINAVKAREIQADFNYTESNYMPLNLFCDNLNCKNCTGNKLAIKWIENPDFTETASCSY